MKISIPIVVPTPVYWFVVTMVALFLTGRFVWKLIVAIRDGDGEILDSYKRSGRKIGIWSVLCLGVWGLLMATR